MSITTSREQRRQLERDNAKLPVRLAEIPRTQWPVDRPEYLSVWRSRGFFVQVVRDGSAVRVSVNRTEMVGDRWRDGISWDDLQRVKEEIGLGSAWMVECYPPDQEVVNVANVRHLWVLPEPPSFGWKRDGR